MIVPLSVLEFRDRATAYFGGRIGGNLSSVAMERRQQLLVSGLESFLSPILSRQVGSVLTIAPRRRGHQDRHCDGDDGASDDGNDRVGRDARRSGVRAHDLAGRRLNRHVLRILLAATASLTSTRLPAPRFGAPTSVRTRGSFRGASGLFPGSRSYEDPAGGSRAQAGRVRTREARRADRGEYDPVQRAPG